MWLSLCIFTFISYILHQFYDEFRGLFLMWNVVGPPSYYPIIGNGHYFMNKTAAEIFEAGINICDLGAFFKFWLGPELKVVLQDQKDIEIILSNPRHIDKSADYDLLKPWLNDGLVLSTGKKWHDRRKIVTPAFHFQMLEKFAETFDRLSNTFISKLYEYEADADIELPHLVGLFALDVVCETAMGVSIDALSQPDSDYIKAVQDITHVVHIRMAKFTLRYELIYRFSKLRKLEADALRVLHGFADDVIRKRREELMEIANRTENDQDNGGDNIGARKKRALLDILLHSTIDDKPLSDLDIREEVDVFMFGGHDTTISAITFALYNLAKYPDVQQKCADEAIKVFGTAATDQPATLQLLNQLSYLELAIKESMRLFATIPVIARKVMEDVKLTNDRMVPKGSTVLIPFCSTFRSPENFDDPNSFKPERFSNEEQMMQKKNGFTYSAFTPFSAGARNCPGQKYAMYEMKCIISKILRNFEIKLSKGSEIEPVLCAEIVLRPENSIKFNLKRRN